MKANKLLLLTALMLSPLASLASPDYLVHEVKGKAMSKPKRGTVWTPLKHLSKIDGSDSIWVQKNSSLLFYKPKDGMATLVRGETKNVAYREEISTGKSTGNVIADAAKVAWDNYGAKSAGEIRNATTYRGESDQTANYAVAAAVAEGKITDGVEISKLVSPDDEGAFSVSVRNNTSAPLFFSVMCVLPDGSLTVPKQMAYIAKSKMPILPPKSSFDLPWLKFIELPGISVIVVASTAEFDPSSVCMLKGSAPADAAGAPVVHVGKISASTELSQE